MLTEVPAIDFEMDGNKASAPSIGDRVGDKEIVATYCVPVTSGELRDVMAARQAITSVVNFEKTGATHYSEVLIKPHVFHDCKYVAVACALKEA